MILSSSSIKLLPSSCQAITSPSASLKRQKVFPFALHLSARFPGRGTNIRKAIS